MEVEKRKIEEKKQYTYEFGGRTVNVKFVSHGNQTELIVTFDPESENPIEMQQTGWQSTRSSDYPPPGSHGRPLWFASPKI